MISEFLSLVVELFVGLFEAFIHVEGRPDPRRFVLGCLTVLALLVAIPAAIVTLVWIF